jgi:homoserine O-acetyltransferase
MRCKVLLVSCAILLGACQAGGWGGAKFSDGRASVANPAPREYPAPVEGDYIVRGYRFRAGGEPMDVRMHYRTFGTLKKDAGGRATNAVLIMHGTGGSGMNFLVPNFAGQLFGKGQLLDAQKYFIILTDSVGHGKSSKPSDGMKAGFPKYGYLDAVALQHRVVTEGLGVNHLRLVMGTSMGGMHTWLWAEQFPDFMDAAMPLASVPDQISGRNRVWRKTIIDSIRNDPGYMEGNYTKQPAAVTTSLMISYFMAENPYRRWQQAPTLEAADREVQAYIDSRLPAIDANDQIYTFESSKDYDPAPGLGKITAPLLAINFADDLINPDDLPILQNNIVHVKNGKAILIAESPQTRGHQTHTWPVVYHDYFAAFLKETEK